MTDKAKTTKPAEVIQEVEIKCIAVDKAAGAKLPKAAKVKFMQQGQLNWYYEPAGLLGKLLGGKLSARLRTLVSELGCTFILKSGADPVNGVDRQEFEVSIPDRSAKAIEALLLATGMFKPVAKWARLRDEYSYKGFTITVDDNSGYSDLFGPVYEIEGPEDAAVELAESMGLRVIGADELQEAYQQVIGNPGYYDDFVRARKLR